uniref:Death domain-containing protein n=1 Tax=Amphimedon queenslandica TaxID=400682 RepID=A0A1X7USI1_AMPQE
MAQLSRLQLEERSFNAFLSSAPLLPELIEHIDVRTKWYLLGTLLHVDDKRLDGIEQLQGHDDTSKTLKMFQHWLTTTPTARKHFCYYDDDVKESEIYLATRSRSNSESSSFDDKEINKHGNHKILFPRDMKKVFEDMRVKFGSAFFKVRRIFTMMKNVNINEVKDLISDLFPDLKPLLYYEEDIGGVLGVVKRKCNIINLRPLEVLAFELNIEDAKPVIRLYKKEAKDFCRLVSVSLCLGEAIATSSHLLCETVVFVLNWNPDETTLQDINDVLNELKPLNKYHIMVKPGQSDEQKQTSLASAQRKESLFTNDILQQASQMKENELKQLRESNEVLKKKLQAIHKMSRAKDAEIEIPKKKKKEEQDVQVNTEQLIDPLFSTTKAEPLSIYGNLTVLPVDSDGLLYHYDKYGITLIIPEGAVQESANVWFGACLYGHKFDFGDYVPITPIVWVYINQELMKPAELYLPHHVDVTTQSSKSKLALLTADDETFYRKGVFMFTSNDDSEIKVEAALCKIYCNHFCSHCFGVNKIAYEDTDKKCQLAVAKKPNDATLLVHVCICPFQPACKKVVEDQYKELGYDFEFSDVIKFESSDTCRSIALEFKPDKDVLGSLGWEGENYGFYSDNK